MKLRTPRIGTPEQARNPRASRTWSACPAPLQPGLGKTRLRPAIVAAATTLAVIFMISLTVSDYILPRAHRWGVGFGGEPQTFGV